MISSISSSITSTVSSKVPLTYIRMEYYTVLSKHQAQILVQSRKRKLKYNIMKSIKSEKSDKFSRYFLNFTIIRITHNHPSSFNIKLKIYKGLQKLDQLEEPIVCVNKVTEPDQSPHCLKFYTNVQDIKKTNQYRILLQKVNEEGEAQIVGINLDIKPLIEDFQNNQVNKTEKTLKIDDTLEITVLILVEKTKQDLSKSISSLSQNSIYKFRSEPNKSFNNSITASDTQSLVCRTTKTKQPTVEYTSLNISKTSQYAEESYQNRSPVKSKLIENGWSQKIIKDNDMEEFPQFEDDFDSISAIGVQKDGFESSKVSGKLILISALLFLALLCYFIITIQDQQSQLSIIRRVVRDTLTEREETAI